MLAVSHGDLKQLKILFERYHRHVGNYLYKVSGNRMLSEDLTQEVFYSIMKYKHTYKSGSFKAWLFTIARNNLASHFRKNKAVHDDLDKVEFKLQVVEDQPKDYSDLQRALNKLEPTDKEVLILNRFQEIKYEEIALITNSTTGAVRTKVCRALKKLKLIYLENDK